MAIKLGRRTDACGTLRKSDAGREVVVRGWVNRRRDHGGLIFVDLRDRSGLLQVVFNPEVVGDAFADAERLRSEYVIAVRGQVRERLEGMENSNLATGEIEVYATDLEILNSAKTPPFPVDRPADVDEMIRLKYRYLDLRRPELQETIMLRHKGAKATRDFLDQRGFLEIETPMLTRSTPEGARDYLVPSRVHPGEFYALPQSPQIFKQLCMVSGFEKYFQIVRCFRDEDLRADRQPEFTQIDVEMSFVEQDDVLAEMEALIAYIFQETISVEVTLPILRMTYDEAMSRFGSDKPDLRFGLELVDVSDIVAGSEFKVFAGTVKNGGQVKAINAKGCARWPRREIDQLGDLAVSFGAKGLAWIAVDDDGLRSPITKFMSDDEVTAMMDRLKAEPGDLLCFVADKPAVVANVLGRLRLHIGKALHLIDNGVHKFVWIVDWPMFEYSEEENRYVAAHHPFTAPHDDDLGLLETNPGQCHAKAYDLVLNGTELGGGSIRIHRRDVQERVFRALGFTDEEAYTKFGFLLDAFEFGTPPHGGIAFGFDRLVMLLADRSSLRECIPFPKTQSATDLMTNAPSDVAEAQLEELHIRLVPEVLAQKESPPDSGF